LANFISPDFEGAWLDVDVLAGSGANPVGGVHEVVEERIRTAATIFPQIEFPILHSSFLGFRRIPRFSLSDRGPTSSPFRLQPNTQTKPIELSIASRNHKLMTVGGLRLITAILIANGFSLDVELCCQLSIYGRQPKVKVVECSHC
jgi:hypothetical protein